MVLFVKWQVNTTFIDFRAVVDSLSESETEESPDVKRKLFLGRYMLVNTCTVTLTVLDH